MTHLKIKIDHDLTNVKNGNYLNNYFDNKKILITGGLGFLGSNLCHQLINIGANVTLLDNMDPIYGGNLYNIHDISKKVIVIRGDVTNNNIITPLILNNDVIFHFAGQVSYIDSLNNPTKDLMLNSLSTLSILDVCRKNNHMPKILFASSRLVVGKVEEKLITEKLLPNPISLYGIHKLLSEKYLHIYHQNFGIPYTIFRISNPYGPRQQVKHKKYSLVGWFIRLAMENRTIQIFGDGRQTRNYIYADDVAEAIIRCAACNETVNEIINIGSDESTELRDMAKTIVSIVGKGRIEYVNWPIPYRKNETGDFTFSIEKLKNMIAWNPSIPLKEGIYRTWQYYCNNYKHYI